MSLSLRARLLLTHGLVVVAVAAALTLLALLAERRWLVQMHGASLERAALAVAGELVDSQALDAAARRADSTYALRISLIARDGRVLADSRVPLPRLDDHSDRPEVIAALAGRMGRSLRPSRSTGVEYVFVAVPARVPGRVAVVRVAEPVDAVRAAHAPLLRDSLLAAMGVIVAGLALLFGLSGRFTDRVRALERVARGIGREGLAPRAAESPADDLGRLGRVLNEMEREMRIRVEALQRERDDRERILAHMSDGVALVDGAGRVAHVNHRLANLLGAARPAEPGTLFQAFARVPDLDELLEAARSEARTVERELRLWSPRAQVLRVTATPLGGPAPAPVLLVLHDLTEAERLQRLRQDFVANVSHELRTPLTSLRGYAETLLEGGLEDVEHRERFVRIIREQAVRLQALVEDLLSLAELERPDVALRRERFDLRAAVERQLATLREPARATGLRLELAAGGSVWVEADRVQVEQAIANLLDNAVKYTERGGVSVRLGADDDFAWFEVRDTGPGIPPEDQPRVFERFYRVDKARSREKGGTGLGLSIVKHAVQLHGGEVSLVSTPGEGSTFGFRIPLRSVAAVR